MYKKLLHDTLTIFIMLLTDCYFVFIKFLLHYAQLLHYEFPHTSPWLGAIQSALGTSHWGNMLSLREPSFKI